jgi:two-component system nitrate/nitrite response regulator NarL
MKILLADDHVLFRDALTQFIYALRPQWMVTTVSNFDDAYNKIEQKGISHFDILLLDIRMPGMNGLDGLKKVRSDFPLLKAAIISGIAREIQVRAAMQMGAAAYFPKTLPGKSLISAKNSYQWTRMGPISCHHFTMTISAIKTISAPNNRME